MEGLGVARPSTHIWRLLKWGRTLARHGALRGIESDPNTLAPIKRLARIARFGTRQPDTPDYAGAFRDIGPAFLDEKGFLSEEMMPDTTHPSEKGHEVWAEAIAADLKEMLGE